MDVETAFACHDKDLCRLEKAETGFELVGAHQSTAPPIDNKLR